MQNIHQEIWQILYRSSIKKKKKKGKKKEKIKLHSSFLVYDFFFKRQLHNCSSAWSLSIAFSIFDPLQRSRDPLELWFLTWFRNPRSVAGNHLRPKKNPEAAELRCWICIVCVCKLLVEHPWADLVTKIKNLKGSLQNRTLLPVIVHFIAVVGFYNLNRVHIGVLKTKKCCMHPNLVPSEIIEWK